MGKEASSLLEMVVGEMENLAKILIFHQLLICASLQERKGFIYSVEESRKYMCDSESRKIFSASSRLQCTGFCLKEEECHLLNFAEKVGHGIPNHNCEICTSSTLNEDCQKVVSSHLWLAMKLKRIPSKNEELVQKDYSSCEEIFERKGASLVSDGVHKLRSGRHYCSMNPLGECRGNGWTLAMTVNGSKETFKPDSALWTDDSLYNVKEGLKNPLSEEAKYPAFTKIYASEVCIGLKHDGIQKWLHIPALGSSLSDTFKTNSYRQTKLGHSKWKTLIKNSSLQHYCSREGFNVHIDSGKIYARIGIISSNRKGVGNKCRQSESYIGIGTKWGRMNGCHKNFNGVSCGNLAFCSPDNGEKTVAAFGMIFVK